MTPVTSFVVLNWNGGDASVECVRSVLAQQQEAVECIVVDNGSEDDSLQKLRAEFPRLAYIENGRNLGFAAGMNRGMAAATGDIIVPLNQDVILDATFAREVRRVFATDEGIGAVGAVVLQLTNEGQTDAFDAGGYLLGRRLAARLYGLPRNGCDDVFGVSGSCPAFRRSFLDDVALDRQEYYDEAYFAYFEDIDLFFRGQLRGWRMVYADSVRCWHYRSMSSGGSRRFYEKPMWIQRCHFRNRYLTLLKNCPPSLAGQLIPGFLLAEVILWPYLLVRSPRSIGALLSAWGAVARALPRTLAQRRRIQGRRRGSASHIRHYIRGL